MSEVPCFRDRRSVWAMSGVMSMERRVLQFMGAYTDLQDTMQFLVYAHLSDDERGSFTKKNPDDRCTGQLQAAVSQQS